MVDMYIVMNGLDPSPGFIHTTPCVLHGEWDKQV